MDEQRKPISSRRWMAAAMLVLVAYPLSWGPVLALQQNGTIRHHVPVYWLYLPVNSAIQSDQRIGDICWTYLKLWRRVFPLELICEVVRE